LTPLEFANKHLGRYKIRGNEIVPELCPFCGGGQHRDKDTFALNLETGVYNCKRGKCGRTGTFKQLCREFGEIATNDRNMELYSRKQRKFTEPKTEVKSLSSPVEEYLRLRGFSKETWEKYKVGEDGKGNIVFPYYENGKLVMVKFRPARKIKKGESKCWREEGGKPVFWGMDLCTPDKPLTIVEGETDCLSLAEAGIENVVSIPSGANDLTCIELCWDWLQQFNKIIIWVDSDQAGQELQRNLINRLGIWRCWIVQCDRKDANEVLYFDGKEKVRELWEKAVETPITGLTRLADAKPFDWSKVKRIKSGVYGLDKILGGFMTGQLSVWTGKSTHGKSTILGQILLEAVEQGYKVCAYSGELTASSFQFWIDLQAAGPEYVNMVYDPIMDGVVPSINAEIREAIHKWYYDYFFLYDQFGLTEETNILEVFEYAVKRYGCKMFLIDNLMTTILDEGQEHDFWRAQSKFVNKLADFAHVMDVHIHLVAHPRKTKGDLLENEDVSGASEITKRADNVLVMQRLNDTERAERQCDSLLIVRKNRIHGRQNVEIELNFDPKCKRFYMPSETSASKQYGWVEYLEDSTGELPWEI